MVHVAVILKVCINHSGSLLHLGQGDFLRYRRACNRHRGALRRIARFLNRCRVGTGTQIEYCGAISTGQLFRAVDVNSCTLNGCRGFSVILHSKGYSVISGRCGGLQIGERYVTAVTIQTGRRVRQRPAETHHNAQGDHVLLRQSIDDLLCSRVDDGGFRQDFNGHVLAHGVDGLIPCTSDHLRGGHIKRTILVKSDRRTIQRIRRGALHIGYKKRATGSILQTAQCGSGFQGRKNAVYHVPGLFHLCDQAICAHDVVIGDAAGCRDVVTSLPGKRDDVRLPFTGAIDTKSDRLIHSLAHHLVNPRGYLAHDVIAGIIDDSLWDRNNDGQLSGGQINIIPRLLRGLLIAGIAVDPVGHRKHIQHRNAGLLAGHVRELSHHGKHCGILRDVLKNGRNDLFLNKGLCGLSINRHILISFSSERFTQGGVRLFIVGKRTGLWAGGRFGKYGRLFITFEKKALFGFERFKLFFEPENRFTVQLHCVGFEVRLDRYGVAHLRGFQSIVKRIIKFQRVELPLSVHRRRVSFGFPVGVIPGQLAVGFAELRFEPVTLRGQSGNSVLQLGEFFSVEFKYFRRLVFSQPESGQFFCFHTSSVQLSVLGGCFHLLPCRYRPAW
nr:MAG TPA: hypothetical protein [Caudoviricetes sp.]